MIPLLETAHSHLSLARQERAGQQNGPLDLSMFNGHLVELMKSDQTQLEQILKCKLESS